MAIKSGTDIQLKINAAWLGGETDTTLAMAADMIDVTTKTSTGAAKEFLAGETSGTITASGLYDPAGTMSFADILALLNLRAAVTVVWGEATTATRLFTASGFISGLTANGPKNDAANYSVDIQLSGVVSESSL